MYGYGGIDQSMGGYQVPYGGGSGYGGGYNQPYKNYNNKINHQKYKT
jgi:hypothetical protein